MSRAEASTGKHWFGQALMLAAVGAALWWALREQPPPPCPDDKCPTPIPTPAPVPDPPLRPRKPWGEFEAPVGVEAHVGPLSPDGDEPQVDLPTHLHIKNRGGSDGAGLCVFASITHSAHWQSVSQLEDLFQWMWTKPGGGYPSKVSAMIKRKCAEKGIPEPEYVQIEGTDLDPIKMALKGGRPAATTYAISPTGRYGGKTIAHMVSTMAAAVGRGPDGKGWWAILDNNYPGTLEWMSEAHYRRAYTGGRLGWAIFLLNGPPPPPPRAKT